MKILMFGWEFPPIYSGGLGTACEWITDWLLSNGHKVYFVLPHSAKKLAIGENCKVKLLPAFSNKRKKRSLTSIKVESSLYSPYLNSTQYTQWVKGVETETNEVNQNYGLNLIDEVHRYAEEASRYAEKIDHKIIHSHDWLTAQAGIEAQKISDKPHVLHIHATEFDRSGENPNQAIYNIERKGMEESDHIIAVSNFTKNLIIKHYGISADKIEVVHNAVKPNLKNYRKTHFLNKKDSIVLFLGRMTMQKGPDYFLRMAQRVLTKKQNVKFVMAGDGDMMEKIIHLATDLGIERNVLFSGFLKGDEIARAYSSADLYVMPSVSEPFGITPLEAIKHGAPVLISKQSWVSEVIKNSLRVDFWDIEEMASKVLAVLEYQALQHTLKEKSQNEVEKLHWHGQAQKIEEVYSKVLK